jgi:phage shock protein E
MKMRRHNTKSERPDCRELMSAGGTVLDVRTEGEFSSGHVPGSVNIPLQDIGDRIAQIRKFHQPVLVLCRSGVRSSVAASILASAGLAAYDCGAWTEFPKEDALIADTTYNQL